MSTAAEHLTRAAEGLRADVRYLQQRRLEGQTLTAAQAESLAVKSLAADIVDQVARERLDAVQHELEPIARRVTDAAKHTGHLRGLGDAIRVLEVKASVARWWEKPALTAACDALRRLADQTAGPR